MSLLGSRQTRKSDAMAYVCAYCGKKIKQLDNFVRCTYCGYRILIKGRPNLSREITTD